MKKKVFIILTSIVIVLITIILVVFKGSIFSNVTDKAKDGYVYVYDNENLLQVADSLEQQGLIKSADGLLKTARIMGFSDKHLIPGRYQVKPGWNNVQLLDFLSRGKQSPC
jgi:cell division protein YceG involved in septum cleavage